MLEAAAVEKSFSLMTRMNRKRTKMELAPPTRKTLKRSRRQLSPRSELSALPKPSRLTKSS